LISILFKVNFLLAIVVDRIDDPPGHEAAHAIANGELRRSNSRARVALGTEGEETGKQRPGR